MPIAAVEHLDIRQHARRAHTGSHLAHVARRVDYDLAAGVHGVEIERADIRTQDLYMLDALFRVHQRGAGRGDLGIVFGGDKTTAGAGGEVDDEIAVLRADAVHDVAIEVELHRRPSRGGIADVDMRHRSPRLRSLERTGGDLLGR